MRSWVWASASATPRPTSSSPCKSTNSKPFARKGGAARAEYERTLAEKNAARAAEGEESAAKLHDFSLRGSITIAVPGRGARGADAGREGRRGRREASRRRRCTPAGNRAGVHRAARAATVGGERRRGCGGGAGGLGELRRARGGRLGGLSELRRCGATPAPSLAVARRRIRGGDGRARARVRRLAETRDEWGDGCERLRA